MIDISQFHTPTKKQYSYSWVYYEAEPREGDKQDAGNINLEIEQLV